MRRWIGWKAGRLTFFQVEPAPLRQPCEGQECPNQDAISTQPCEKRSDWLPPLMGLLIVGAVVAGCTAICRAKDTRHEPRTEHYHTIEFNTFGSFDSPRCCALFRDEAGFIQAWRYEQEIGEHLKLPGGRYMFLWTDHVGSFCVTCDHLSYTRTAEDVEMQDRNLVVPWQPRTGLLKPSQLRTITWADVPDNVWLKGGERTFPLERVNIEKLP